MEEGVVDRTNIRAVALGALVVFLAGIALGYYVWGYRAKHNQDYKDMLRQTISYISTLEEKNRDLTERVGRLENEADSLKKQLGQPHDTKTPSQDSRVADLEKENQDLVKENEHLRKRVQSLMEELNARTGQDGKAGSPRLPGGEGF